MVTSDPAARARWEVIWVHNGSLKRRKFGADLAAAVEHYTKAVQASKRGATLRCCNIGFAPPEHLRPHERVVKLKGRKKPTKVRVTPMRKLNRERGLWWCPYCMHLRTFVHRKSTTVEGVKMRIDAWGCQVCGITTRDTHVQQWNPLALEVEMHAQGNA